MFIVVIFSELLEFDNLVVVVCVVINMICFVILQELFDNVDVVYCDILCFWLLVFIDLQVVKVSGVIFVVSMLECVIEEQVCGDVGKVELVCKVIMVVIGDNFFSVVLGLLEVV